MPAVRSSAVETVEYDPRRKRLLVTFTGGARYAYARVDSSTYAALLAAESKGRFVNAIIKPSYPATRLTAPPARGR